MKQEHVIPINTITAQAIQNQQIWLQQQADLHESPYLFPEKDLNPIDPERIRTALNKLAVKENIVGSTGKLWRFQPHQFRHTVGTRMVNAGTPVHIVQRYLVHSSPEMTMSYAHIYDSTMKNEYLKYQEKLVDHQGVLVKTLDATDLPEDLKWLKANVLGQALPNGYCALPIQQGSCPHANACLSCSHFRTSVHFIPQHKQQAAELEKMTQVAKDHGWVKQAEMNSSALNKLQKILVTLETRN